MFNRIAILMICFLSLGAFVKVHPQVKITPETTALPADYKGVDPVVLARNLKTWLAKNQASRNSKQPVYENLTVDDLFAFIPEPSDWVSGPGYDSSVFYQGQLYRLIPANEFPAPQIVEIKDCGGGFGIGNGRRFSSREELVSDFNPRVSPESVWVEGMIHLKTTFPTAPKPQNYKGVSDAGCSGAKFFVPLAQDHYELAFAKTQPYRLLDVSQSVFRFDNYRYETVNGAGIVVWKPEVRSDERADIIPLFITRLAAPYLKTETLTAADSIEKKSHSATRHKIYVELAAVWLVNRSTGEIISKKAADTKESTADVPQKLPTQTPGAGDEPLQILTKPRAVYTEAGKEIQGKVILRVTFSANGTIGAISVISGLGGGLTEQAIAAARRIKFKPAKKNGIPISVTKPVEYVFVL